MPVEASLWIRTQPSLTLKIWQNSEPGQNPWKYKKSLEMSKSNIKKRFVEKHVPSPNTA